MNMTFDFIDKVLLKLDPFQEEFREVLS